MEAEMVTGSGRVVRVSLGLGKSHVQGAGICRSGEIAKTRTAHGAQSALPNLLRGISSSSLLGGSEISITRAPARSFRSSLLLP